MVNYMEEVVEMLGVVMGEKFKVKSKLYEAPSLYFFCNDGLHLFNGDGTAKSQNNIFVGLLNGDFEIVKPPFRPQRGQDYWGYDGEWTICRIHWRGSYYDYTNLFTGTVFRTEREALAQRPEIYKKFTGQEWEDDANV
ncbi:hypothetical protein [Phascolarctobacterium sp.]|uniref:hypothetical protein n=1 Tax=Phascolarctobacterium sp. TaxID=2049039 RepID=UPI003864DE23